MASPAILVAVADPLGLAVVERLIHAGAEITALVSAAQLVNHQRELEHLGARVVVGSTRSPVELQDAGLGATGTLVIAGAGHVGSRVARILARAGHRIVVVERAGDNRHLGQLRLEGHHADETLELAGVDRAATVLALTDSDASNLHIALVVRAWRPGVPVVIRLGSPELSTHVADRQDALAVSSGAGPSAAPASGRSEIR